jgi:single-strand DNA-binding protein
MKKLIVTGNVGRDPELKQSSKGEFIIFSIGVYKKKDLTEWIDCSVFNQNLIKIIQNYVKKGSKVLLEGEPYVNSFTTKDGTNKANMNLIVNSIELLNKVEQNTEQQNYNTEDIPF